MADAAGAVADPSPYTLKRGPYSSHSLLLEQVPAQPGQVRALDVGGGEGYLSQALTSRGCEVVCLAAPGSVRGTYPGVSVVEADLDFAPPSLDGPFRYVVCGDVVEHVRDPARLLGWLRTLLDPEGRLLGSLPNSGHFHFRWNVLRGRFPADERGLFDRTHLHFYTWDGWCTLFAEAGFVIESVRPTPIPFGLALGLPEEHLIVRLLDAVYYGLARLWKTLFAYQFVIVARSAPSSRE